METPRVILPAARAPRVEVKPAERPCAVPPLDALRPGQKAPAMPRVQPPRGSRTWMREVQVPAPSCDDVKRKK